MDTSLIAGSDHRPVLREIRELGGEAAVAAAVRSEMAAILEHCIECNWGACHNTKFEELVWPYLDDVAVLDGVLRSQVIRETGDLVVGSTGARAFPHLLEKLSGCRNADIRDYLAREFGGATGCRKL